MKNKLLIVDGHSLAYRCFYALKNSPTGLITDKIGTPITITSGFLRSLSLLLAKHKPTHLAIAFDSAGETWRHRLYPEYKGNRHKDPDEQELIQVDIRNLQAILREKEIRACKISILEADDIIATICDRLHSDTENDDNLQIVISTADKDLLQLVDDELNICVDYQHGRNSQIYHEKEIVEEFGIKPCQIPDYKALVGDKSDNIPGVKGIGKISASHVLSDNKGFHFATAIANNLDKIPPMLAKKIEPQKEQLLLWYKLTKLKTINGLYYFLDDFENTDLSVRSAIAVELGVEQ